MIRAATCGLVALAVLASGCSARSAASPAGSQRPVTGSQGSASHGSASHGSASHGSASQRNTSPVGVTTRSLPGCTTAVQQARSFAAADVAAEKVPGRPFGVAVTANGRWAFVSLGPTVGVFRIGSSALPVLVRRIQESAGVMLGNGLSPDNRYLLAANGGTGAAVLSAPLAEHGGQGAILGTLSARGGSPGGAIEAAVSPDGRYAFVSLEYAFEIAVFSLRRVQSGGVGQAAYVGSVPAQLAPVGLALSPEGRWLYSTSEAEGPATNVGSLTVIDVAKAETDPAHSTVARVPAGCNPVRVVTSADGSVVWVTARASDAVLAFSASKLRTDPAHALLADVRVGELPVGLALVRGGTRIVVADSNRFGVGGQAASLAIVDVPAALAGRLCWATFRRAGSRARWRSSPMARPCW